MTTKAKKSKKLELFLSIGFVLTFLVGLVLIMRDSPGKSDMTNFGYAEMGRGKGIGVINVNGMISFSSGGGMFSEKKGSSVIVEQIRRFGKSDSVKGLVIRVNSPGGTIGATQEIYNAIKRFKVTGKPVVVSMGDLAASGGYYIATAADYIYANKGTITGSIGVIISAPDFSGFYKWMRVKWNTIKSGRYKDILSSSRKMRTDEKKLLLGVVKNAYQDFFSAVLKGRQIKRKKLEQLAQGQVFSGNQAKKNGLVDDTGDFEAALLKAGKLAGISGRPIVISQKRRLGLGDFLKMFGKSGSSGIAEEFVRALKGFSADPGVYFLHRSF